MKWKFPGHNAHRVKRKFAWLPTELSNRDLIWLETYWQAEKFWDIGNARSGLLNIEVQSL